MPSEDISKGIAMRMAQGGVDKISYLTVTSGIDKYCTFNTYATDRVVQKGEYVLVDISGHIDGYASDLTRVFYLGTVPREEREMAETASGCVAAAKEAMKPRSGHDFQDRQWPCPWPLHFPGPPAGERAHRRASSA